MAEYRHLVEFIEGLGISLVVSHWDVDPRNMLYNRETEEFWLVDYENVNTELFTHDLARYFVGAYGIPPDFGNLPSEDIMKQFLKCYMEERYKIQGRPLSGLTADRLNQVLHGTKANIMFICFMFAVSVPLFMTRCKHYPPDIDLIKSAPEDFKHYYRMKEELFETKFATL